MVATATGTLNNGVGFVIYADPKKSVTNMFVTDKNDKVMYGRTVATTDMAEATEIVLKKLERY